jgi:hypothetical protein
MLRRQSDADDERKGQNGLIIGLFVLFFIFLILFLFVATNYIRSQAEARSVADIAATQAAHASVAATFTPDFSSLVLIPTETISIIPTETETAVPTETETVMPAEVDPAAPVEVEPSSPTPKDILPLTGGDSREEQAAAARQWIRLGVEILAVSLIVLGLLFRLKHK